MKIEKREPVKFDVVICESDIAPLLRFSEHAYKAESTERLHQWLKKAIVWSTQVNNVIRRVLRYRAVLAICKALNCELINPRRTHTHNLAMSYKGSFDGAGITASMFLSYDSFTCTINGH